MLCEAYTFLLEMVDSIENEQIKKKGNPTLTEKGDFKDSAALL